MPRGAGNWNAWFKARESGRSRRRSGIEESDRSTGFLSAISLVLPRVVGEAVDYSPAPKRSRIRDFARDNLKNRTRAEKEFARILYLLNQGILRGRFKQQYVISGKWIVDFFFPEVRLAVEIDGSIHQTPEQIELDKQKEADCQRFDITLIRISNDEVFGRRDVLVAKLRDGWRMAKARPNTIIGKRSPLSR